MGVRGLLPLLRDHETPQTEVHDFTAQTVHVDVMGTYFAFLRAGYFSALRKQASSMAKHQNAQATSVLSTASTGSQLFNLVVMENCDYVDATLIRPSTPPQSSTTPPTTPPTPQQSSAVVIPYPQFYSNIAETLNGKLSRYGLSPSNATLHFDGMSAREKQKEHSIRSARTTKNLAALTKETNKYC
ncbi:hypothetical protein EDD21DRAFT_373158, partial [Dissophora ornata]